MPSRKKFGTIDEYISIFPINVQDILEKLLKTFNESS